MTLSDSIVNCRREDTIGGKSTTQNEAQQLKQPYCNVTANPRTQKSLRFNLRREGKSD